MLEMAIVSLSSFLSLQVKWLWNGRMRLGMTIRAANWEQVTVLRVLDIALVCIYGEFVIQAEDFGLAKQYLGFLFLLQFSEF